MLHRPGPISRFLIGFALLFSTFAVAWLGVGTLYARAFCGSASVIFRSIGSHGQARFIAVEGDGSNDMEISLRKRNQETEVERIFEGSTRLQGYRPTTFLAALILATPIAWRRRWIALGWGLVVIHLYVGIRVLIFLLWAFTVWAVGAESELQLMTLGPVSQGLLEFAHWFFVVSFGGWMVVPVPIWFLLVFRAGDLRALTSTAKRS